MCVQDEQWAERHERFPEHTPVNKEYYLLRSMFEERFPSAAALNTVPKGLSIACSTPEAVAWDPEWANIHDISGRAVAVHDASAGYQTATDDDISAGPPTQASNGSVAFNGQAKGAVSGAVVTVLDGAAGTNINGKGIGTNGSKKAPQRTVSSSALPRQQQVRTMHAPQPQARARRHAMVSASRGVRIGLRLK